MPSLSSASYLNKQLSTPELPSLRNLILVRNEGSYDGDHVVVNTPEEAAIYRHSTDFRDILIWSDASREESELEKVRRDLQKDDVINLQFTR